MIDRSQTDLSTAPMVLASRKSKLAMAQTEEVRRSILPVPAEILGLSTKGDEVLDRPLVDVGGKGVFIKTLEAALLDGAQMPRFIHSKIWKHTLLSVQK